MKKIASRMGPYTRKVVECFNNPKNYGKIKNPDGVGKVGNPICGDVMWLYIKVAKNKKLARNASPARQPDGSHGGGHSDAGGGQEIIKDIKFETFGCVAAIATSTILTQMAKGKTLVQARNIDKQKIVKSLGGLPPIKIHCSVLAASALNKAIDDYEEKKAKKNKK